MKNVFSDEHIASKAVKGCQSSFSLLVTRHNGMLRAMLKNLCQCPDEADDLVQKSFINAWEKLSQFEGNNFKSWLCKVAFRQFLMWKRAQKVTEPIDDAHLVQNDTTEAKTLEGALKHLTEAQREIITLNYLAGFSHTEISLLTGVPIGTVKSHAVRGMKQLKKILGE